MQNIIFFFDPSEKLYETPMKIGKLYLNRFTIDENAAFDTQSLYFMPESKHRDKDSEIFESAIRKVAEAGVKDSTIHIIYAGIYYLMHTDKMKSLILNEMKKYGINSVLVTLITQSRKRLVTKETMKDYYNGKVAYGRELRIVQRDPTVNMMNMSVNDDLEELLENLKIGEVFKESVWSYFLPKLTEEELKLIEVRDEDHLKTYSSYGLPEQDPDISEEEMKLSDSKSKFLKSDCFRWSFKIENCHTAKPVLSNTDSSQSQTELRRPCSTCNNFHRKIRSCHQCYAPSLPQ